MMNTENSMSKISAAYQTDHPACTRRSRYANREARIRLTTKCNYRCFFCHEEGGCQAPAAEWDSLRDLLLALKRQGRREITFTGGEPLLNKGVLVKALDEIASWDVQPVVTVITNAALMDEMVIEALERCHSAKVHVSIHDPRTAAYRQITGQTIRTAEELKPVLRRLSSGSVRLKLNAVITDGLVKDENALPAILGYAREVGASAVKFVELLETRDSSCWPMKGIPAQALGGLFSAAGFSEEGKTLRTEYWRSEDGLILEVSRCACALGCGLCEATRGDSFTGGTHYHPCFFSSVSIAMSGRSLEDVLKEGDDIINQFRAKRNAA